MFDIGWGELVVIGIVALIAIGPKELPTVLRTLGQYMAKVRRMASEFQGQFQEAMREAELHDLKKQAEDLGSSVSDMTSFDPMADVQKDLQSAIESEPAKPELPAPETQTESADAAAQTDAAPTALATVDVPPPAEPAPVPEKDFAAVEPPAKQAGGKA
jgi:sec-independent protein translocase protein TatB